MDAEQIRKRHSEAGGLTLLVDDIEGASSSGIAKLSDIGLNVSCLWAGDHFLRGVRTVTLSKPRPANELYRALANVARFVEPGGAILVLPYEATPDHRFEATEVFLGAHPGWERNLVGNAVELKRTGVSAKAPAPGTGAKRVVGLSLFGCGGFWDSTPVYIRAHHALFPGYELRIHHDDAIDKMPYGAVLRALAANGLVKLVHMEPDGIAIGKCRSMLWRLAPAWDPEVEYVFARDLDSLPAWSDRCAVEEFVAAGQDAHTIHDAQAHAGFMGGLCGYRAAALRAFSPTFDSFIKDVGFSADRWAIHGADQDVLNAAVRPFMTTFGHSLRIGGHNRNAAMGSIKYVTEIAPPSDKVTASVSAVVREKSDTLIPYLGSAGYPITAALAFYDKHGGAVVDQIRAIEEAAAGRDC